ncbi:hypothetical protein A9W98_10355 [Mycobacterium gordonae]|uniref:Uncharacterized protein n=1 Tax=Mycobacterium gordonae TaxID=1778 RepID=A0A1A6BLQ9_MYCGO|nr:hypothetical protein A9W98_10355 [Mycobacterium gordonae]
MTPSPQRSGDFYMATSGDFLLATDGDFLMAMDTPRSGRVQTDFGRGVARKETALPAPASRSRVPSGLRRIDIGGPQCRAAGQSRKVVYAQGIGTTIRALELLR